uniref:Cilia- and flagella-associated protein 157 n=1 Tax=Lygus hesperus TaxID=30085 RepID=A0A0A9XBQ5_LYGHE
MGPKKEPLDTKGRKDILRGLKKHLSKEIEVDTFTAADQAYLEYWTAEKLKQIDVLKDLLHKRNLENEALKSALQEIKNKCGERIAELRSRVNGKCDEIADLTEQNHNLLDDRESKLKSFDEQLNRERLKFEDAKERFSCEIKMLNTKLNNVENFRAERDHLIEKHVALQNYLRDMEERAAGIVHVYQRLDLINKDRMGQELKDRLLKLSIEFQEASQTETTRSLIRENIAINNELGGHIGSWQALHDENYELKKERHSLITELRGEDVLKEKCLSLNVLQTEVIERLAYEQKKLDLFHQETNNLQELMGRLGKKLEEVTAEATAAELEANLQLQAKHNLMTQVNELEHNCMALSNIIYDEEINLKKALLHVAEAQDFKQRKERLRF